MNKWFRLDSPIMQGLSRLSDLVILSFVWFVCCLPIVTIGAAWSGLYGAVRYSIRGDSWFEGFKYGFKCHFWRNLVGWTFGALVCGYAATRVYMGVTSIMANPALMTPGVIVPIVISGIVALAAALVIAVMLPLGMYFPQIGRAHV